MTIAEVGKLSGLSPDTLRYYERVGLIPRVGRTSGGIRNYTQGDCNWIEFIKCMRGAGLSVEALIEYVRLFQQGDATAAARKEILVEQRRQLAARIEEEQRVLQRLDRKIDGYEEILYPCEQKLRG